MAKKQKKPVYVWATRDKGTDVAVIWASKPTESPSLNLPRWISSVYEEDTAAIKKLVRRGECKRYRLVEDPE